MRNSTLITIKVTLGVRIDILTDNIARFAESDGDYTLLLGVFRKELAELQAAYDDIAQFQETGKWPEN